MESVQSNTDLVRKHMIDPYSECIKRPSDALTREQLLAEANKSVHSALELETSIREKEKDLRSRMGEKSAILKMSKETGVKAGPNFRELHSFQDLIADSERYFEGPLTEKVNLRSVLEAHSATLSRKELNKIINHHNEACYEEPYGKSMVDYCAQLVSNRKAKEDFPN
jgi:hypothetical protein